MALGTTTRRGHACRTATETCPAIARQPLSAPRRVRPCGLVPQPWTPGVEASRGAVCGFPCARTRPARDRTSESSCQGGRGRPSGAGPARHCAGLPPAPWGLGLGLGIALTLAISPAPALAWTDIAQGMVEIPGGTFQMGCSPGDTARRRRREAPAPSGRVGPFRMGKYEVTQAQWKAVMDGRNPYSFQGDDRPVENVSWDDARDSSRALTPATPASPTACPRRRSGSTPPGRGPPQLSGRGARSRRGQRQLPQLREPMGRRGDRPGGELQAQPLRALRHGRQRPEVGAGSAPRRHQGAPGDGSQWQGDCWGDSRLEGARWLLALLPGLGRGVSDRSSRVPAGYRPVNIGLRLAQDL